LAPQNPSGAAFAVPSKIYSIMAAGRPFICTAEEGSPLDRLRAVSNAFIRP
jgi:colanic acid biosynthesis glycosyl transferase WcaI